VIPVGYLQECFEADTEAGVVRWKEQRSASHFCTPSAEAAFRRFAGRVAGRVHRTGYLVVTITFQAKAYKVLAHRIVWALHYGAWPTQYIDHINRVRLDNRIANLRDVSRLENARNSCRWEDKLVAVQRNQLIREDAKRRGQRFDAQPAPHSAFGSLAA
jgi:HNH endonuclease